MPDPTEGNAGNGLADAPKASAVKYDLPALLALTAKIKTSGDDSLTELDIATLARHTDRALANFFEEISTATAVRLDRLQVEAAIAAHRAAVAKSLKSLGLADLPYTDSGNAERFVRVHGGNLRYCHATKAWWAWEAGLWRLVDDGRLLLYTKTIARDLLAEADQIADETKLKRCVAWAIKSESIDRKKAAIASAQSERGVPIYMRHFDRDPYALCVQNGTIDLRTGVLRSRRREDYITKVSPVAYDLDARSELWEQFLTDTTGGNQELMDFLQVAVGYSLTGDTREEKLFFVHGPGGSGKSTFLEAVKVVLGDYAKTADFEAFVQRRDAGGVRNDIAELAGRRLVVSIEVDEGKKLAEGLVKMVTGGDTVRARFLYQESFEFQPQVKLWLAANHSPRVKADDDAMWRRILRVPFDQAVPQDRRDPTVKARLKDVVESGPAILAWAVKGCLRWLQNGLVVPSCVSAATEQYRVEMDHLKDFLEEVCDFSPALTISSKVLWLEYEKWAESHGIKDLVDFRQIAVRLRNLGCTDAREYYLGQRQRVWRGIGFAPMRPETD